MARRNAILLSLVILFSYTYACNAAVKKPAPQGKLQTIRGVVVNQGGKHIPRATIYVLDDAGSLRKTLSADRNGRFSCIAPPRCSIVAVCNGYSYGMVDDCSAGSPVRVRLWPEFKMAGTVTDESGKPLSGVSVIIRHFSGYSRSGSIEFPTSGIHRWNRTTTDSKGRYVLPHLPDPKSGTYYFLHLEYNHNGRASVTRQVYDIKHQPNVKLPPECILEGSISYSGNSGRPVKGTSVVAIPSDSDAEARSGFADKNGRFRIRFLSPGTAIVMVPAATYEDPQTGRSVAKMRDWVAPAAKVVLKPGKPTTVDMVLTRGAVIKGLAKMRSDGTPVKSGVVTVEHAGSPADNVFTERVSIGSNGEFAVRVVPGDVKIRLDEYEDIRYFANEEAPTVSVKSIEGEEQPVEIPVVVPRHVLVRQPVPDDFELTPGTYELTWDPDLKYGPLYDTSPPRILGNSFLRLLKGKPKKASKDIVYNAYRLDGAGIDGMLLLGIDRSKPKGEYDVCYIDCNRNWDLSDEAPITSAGGDSEPPWLEIQSHQGRGNSERTSYPIKIRAEVYTDYEGHADCYFEKKGGWKGLIDTSKDRVECAVTDNDWDGLCGGRTGWSDHPGRTTGDRIYVDDNGFGSVVTLGSPTHTIDVSPVSKVGSKFYLISASHVGNKLTIRPYAGPTGTIIVSASKIEGLSAKVQRAFLVGSGGRYSFTSPQAGGMVVPVGRYAMKDCSLILESAKDGAGGNAFPLTFDLKNAVEVTANAQFSVDLSGNVMLAINPEDKKMAWRAGRSAGLHWQVAIGKDITLTELGDGNDAFEPTVKFINKLGKTIRTVKAGYT